jgi:hypothetical protein
MRSRRRQTGRTVRLRVRAGFILHETITAVLIILAVVGGAYQILHLIAKQRHLSAQRALATLEVGNIMEELACRSWSDVNAENPKVALSEDCRRKLPDARLRLEIVPDEANSRRITIALDWQSQSDRRSEPVSLVAWRHQPVEALP